MTDGFIKVHRKLLENAIFYKADYFQIWSYILLKVNYRDAEIIWNNEKKLIKRGSGIFSQKKISEELRISIGTVHNCLKYLKSESQIEIKTTPRFTEIQVVNWDEYQDAESLVENRMKTERKRIETNKKNKKNKNNIREDCQPYILKYGQDMIESFLRYWEEKDSKGDQKWEKQKTWETNLRLETWKKNEEKWGNKKPSQKANGPNKLIL